MYWIYANRWLPGQAFALAACKLRPGARLPGYLTAWPPAPGAMAAIPIGPLGPLGTTHAAQAGPGIPDPFLQGPGVPGAPIGRNGVGTAGEPIGG